jgi:hypothetical protein
VLGAHDPGKNHTRKQMHCVTSVCIGLMSRAIEEVEHRNGLLLSASETAAKAGTASKTPNSRDSVLTGDGVCFSFAPDVLQQHTKQ